MSRRWDDNWGCGKTPTYPTPPPGNYYVTDEEKNKWNGKQDALVYDEVPTASSPNVVNSGCLYIAFDEQYKRIRAEYRDYFDSSSSGLSAIANQITAATDLLQVIQVEVHADREAVREDKAAVDQAVITTLSYQNSAASSAQDAKRFRDEAERFRNEAEGSTEICREAIEASKVAVQAKDDAIAARDNAAASAAASAKSATNANNAASRADVYAASASNSEFIAKKSATDAKTFRDETKVFRDEAEKFRNDAFSTTPAGYEEVVNKVNDTEKKVDIIINEGQLGITTEAKGKEITVNDSTNAKLVSFNLHGQSEQTSYSGKNLFKTSSVNDIVNGVSFVELQDHSVHVKGTATKDIEKFIGYNKIPSGKYILSGCPKGGGFKTYYLRMQQLITWGATNDIGDGSEIEIVDTETNNTRVAIEIISGQTVDLVFKPMVRKADIQDSTYEPYVGAKPSPSPDYPQDIITSGESYNLLENVGESTAIDNIVFTKNADGSVTVKGKSSKPAPEYTIFRINTFKNLSGEYVLTGCPKGGSNESYFLGITNTKNYATRRDEGTGYKIQLDATILYKVEIYLYGGKEYDLTFYPMIRKATETRTRYMPYKKGSVEVVSGGKNLIDTGIGKLDMQGVKWEWNNGHIIGNGTPTDLSNTEFFIYNIKPNETEKTFFASLQGIKENVVLSLILYNSLDENINAWGNLQEPIDLSKYKNPSKMLITIKRYSNNTPIKCDAYLQLEIGDKATSYEPYKTPITSIIPTPDGLNGIKVTSGGNYTDENGQQWITDELVKYEDGSGKYIKRIGKAILDGSEGWIVGNTSKPDKKRFYTKKFSDIRPQPNFRIVEDIMCEMYPTKYAGELYGYLTVGIALHGVDVYIYDDKYSTSDSLEAFKTMLSQKKPKFIYVLATPQETPLSSEQMTEIEKLKTFYPTTHITNDGVCGIEMKYHVDQKNYIDGQIAIMKAQQEQNLLNTLLLMPEETQAKMIENDTNNILKEVQ